MKKTTVFDCTLLHLPINHKDSGNITALHNNLEIPFSIKRVYYLYDVPGGEERGGHAHKELQQLIIAASGSFDLTIQDGLNKRTFNLNRPYHGVLMPAGLWRELSNFSSGSICLVMASTEYNENDYIRDYDNFLKYKNL
jgi:hypothetical protein